MDMVPPDGVLDGVPDGVVPWGVHQMEFQMEYQMEGGYDSTRWSAPDGVPERG